jgi:hypothetical protein
MVDYILISRSPTGFYLVKEVLKDSKNIDSKEKIFQTFNLAFDYARQIESLEGVVVDPELNHLLNQLTNKEDINQDFPSYSSFEQIGKDGLVNFDEYGEFETTFIVGEDQEFISNLVSGYSRIVITIRRNELPEKSFWHLFFESPNKIEFEIYSTEPDAYIKGIDFIINFTVKEYFNDFDKSEALAVLKACEKSVNFIN